MQAVLQACEQEPREPQVLPPRRTAAESCHHQDQQWEALGTIDLVAIFQKRCLVLHSCPYQFRGRYRHASTLALQERHDATIAGDVQREGRAWKLFNLLPFMLLRKP